MPQRALYFEPELAVVDRLLDDDALFRLVQEDLARRYTRTPLTGRPSTPVEVVLRLLVVKHLYGWSYQQTERFVADRLVLRQFCRLALEPVPDDTTLLRWANTIRPATLHRLLDRVVELARVAKATRGRKLRVDGTAVETDVHHPSDSTLLADGARVLGRLVRRPLPRPRPERDQTGPAHRRGGGARAHRRRGGAAPKRRGARSTSACWRSSASPGGRPRASGGCSSGRPRRRRRGCGRT